MGNLTAPACARGRCLVRGSPLQAEKGWWSRVIGVKVAVHYGADRLTCQRPHGGDDMVIVLGKPGSMSSTPWAVT